MIGCRVPDSVLRSKFGERLIWECVQPGTSSLTSVDLEIDIHLLPISNWLTVLVSLLWPLNCA